MTAWSLALSSSTVGISTRRCTALKPAAGHAEGLLERERRGGIGCSPEMLEASRLTLFGLGAGVGDDSLPLDMKKMSGSSLRGVIGRGNDDGPGS